MNILLVNFADEKIQELSEFLDSRGYSVYSADDNLGAVEILNNAIIHKVVIHLTTLINIGLINYINHHFSKTKILLVTNNYVEQTISIIKNCSCEIIHEPLTLSALGQKLQA